MLSLKSLRFPLAAARCIPQKFSRTSLRPSRWATRPIRQLSSNSPRSTRYDRFVDPEHPFDVLKWDTTTKVVAVVVAGGGVYYVSHLERVPETGRWRFMDVSAKYEAILAKTAHDEVMQEFKGKILPENHPLTRHVRRVVTRILESNNLGVLKGPEGGLTPPSSITDDLWAPQLPTEETSQGSGPGGKEWNLIVVNDDKIVNAAASFGNVIVFTGILPVAKDEQGLATVLGHEIAHVVARHNSERYSSVKVLLAFATLLEIAGLDFGMSRLIATLLLELPNSRQMESEADKIGLKLFARACYDPQSAPEMYGRLGQLEGRGGLNLAFIRTHPTSDQRIKALEKMLPEAYAVQAASPDCGETYDNLVAFRDTFAQAPWGDGRNGAIRRWS